MSDLQICIYLWFINFPFNGIMHFIHISSKCNIMWIIYGRWIKYLIYTYLHASFHTFSESLKITFLSVISPISG